MRASSVLFLTLAAVPAFAHVMSMSHGDLRIAGSHATFTLRMPLYEIAHVDSPEAALFTALEFSSNGVTAKFTRGRCREDRSYFRCEAEYEFGGPVGRLSVASTLHQITVPNHVHVLTADRDGTRDQAVLDLTFPRAEIRFDPPTAVERLTSEGLIGAARALGGPVQWMFLVALVLAGRSRGEIARVAAAFAAAQLASAIGAPLVGYEPAPRFVEAAMALSVAYLAVEIVFLPEAGHRTLVAAALGLFHGLYFAQFLRAAEIRPAPVLAAAVIVELAAVGLIGVALSRLRKPWVVRGAAAALGLIGLGWFAMRMLR